MTDSTYRIDETGAAVCVECGQMVETDNGTCTNVGACYAADRASVPLPGERMKSPQAFTISGNVD